MGCCANLTRENDGFQKRKIIFQKITCQIENVDKLVVSQENLFNERKGTFEQDYELLSDTVYTGTHSIIKKGLHKLTGSLVAVKIVNYDLIEKFSATAKKNYLQGLEILKKMDHPNLLKLIDLYCNENTLQIVTEFYSGGELFEQLMKDKNFNETMCSKIMKQILLGLNYLHKNRIVHRGVTPENLVFEGSRENFLIKIIDFKLLTYLPEKQFLTDKVGAVFYIAPEILEESYDFKCDIWSCGVLLFVMLCGKFPFNGKTNVEILQNIKEGNICKDSADYKSLSNEVKDFLSKLLKVKPSERLSAEEALQHQWLKDRNRNRMSISKIINFGAVENLKQFRIFSKLQKMFWIYLINYFLRPEEKDELSQFFHELDKEGKGYLNSSDILNLLKKVRSNDPEKETEKVLKSFGNPVSEERLSFTEFLMGSLEKKTFLSEERVNLAFSSLCKVTPGRITIVDLKNEFGGERITENVWHDLLLEVTGKPEQDSLSLEEFKTIIFKSK